MAHISRDMRRLTPETRRTVRPALKKAGAILADRARSNASWSTRIPAAITVQTSFRKDREKVQVRVNAKKAPHARPYEGITSRSGSFRHPVFGDGNRRGSHDYSVWVSSPTRPFLLPAAESAGKEAVVALLAALDAASQSTVTGA